MAEIEVSGLAELDKALKELPAKLEGNVLRGAMRAGVKMFRDLARQKVPIKTGELRNSIRIKTSLRDGKAMATLTAGNAKAFYAHMIEFGTGSFYTGTGSRSVGGPYIIVPKGTILSRTSGARRQRLVEARLGALVLQGRVIKKIVHPGTRPHPFMRPAFDEGTDAAIMAARSYIAKRLEKEGVNLKPEGERDDT